MLSQWFQLLYHQTVFFSLKKENIEVVKSMYANECIDRINNDEKYELIIVADEIGTKEDAEVIKYAVCSGISGRSRSKTLSPVTTPHHLHFLALRRPST